MTALRISSFAVFATMVLSNSAAVESQDELHPEDLVAGYRQNQLLFQSMFVEWREQTVFSENTVQLFRLQDGITPDEVKQRTSPVLHRHQFRSRGEAFQIRCPKPRDRERLEKYEFPVSPSTPDYLVGDYLDTEIITYSGDPEEGIRVWGGKTGPRTNGAILSSIPPEGLRGARLPPLAMLEPPSRFIVSDIDRFFLETPEAIRLVTNPDLQKHALHGEVVSVEKIVPAQDVKDSWSLDPRTAKYSQEIQVFRRFVALIDVSRGCLPVRIEEHFFFTHDGTRYDDICGMDPQHVTTIDEITSIDNTGYYPTRITQRSFTISASETRDRLFPGAIIEGVAPIRLNRGDFSTVPFEIVKVVAPLDDDSLAFEFPEGTLYFDHRVSKVRGYAKGGPESILGMQGGIARHKIGPRDTERLTAPTWRRLLVGINIFILVVAGAWLFLRNRSR